MLLDMLFVKCIYYLKTAIAIVRVECYAMQCDYCFLLTKISSVGLEQVSPWDFNLV